ncbi:hypothetical protein BDP27DRAFT_1319844 [Rhodocollybia butyracea]|uniref:Uncharacterized protein n=1 Tax=Rhodocollybia butyracea TaxID=206335 RepID=A0A9P5UC15_9AGAR|nr:hypothetical protein BDP27DRAFT_1319844 [Rhodocollybia butyracea]
MASSFAVYASQFINNTIPANLTRPASSEHESEHPMFFSFTTDANSRPGSPRAIEDREEEEYDLDDPHMELLGSGRGYLTDIGGSESSAQGGGWLANQLPSQEQRRGNRLDEQEDELELSESDSELPSGLIHSGIRTKTKSLPQSSPLPPPPRVLPRTLAVDLTESLLPQSDDKFTLNLRTKYNDALWTTLWLSAVSVCYIAAFVLLFTTHAPASDSAPYPTLLHTLPLLIPLILFSALAAYTHIFFILFLRLSLRSRVSDPIIFLSALGTPIVLAACTVWAWGASFGSGTGTTLRIFSLIPLVLAIYISYRLYRLFTSPGQVEFTTVPLLLTLSTQILSSNPLLLAFSPFLLFVLFLGSMPFGVLGARLLISGTISLIPTLIVWLWSWAVVRGVLRVVSAGVVGGWYFGVPRVGIARDIEDEAGDPDDTDADLEPPPQVLSDAPSHNFWTFPSRSLKLNTFTFHSAFHRAVHTSLGSISCAAVVLGGIDVFLLLFFILKASLRLICSLVLTLGFIILPTLIMVLLTGIMNLPSFLGLFAQAVLSCLPNPVVGFVSRSILSGVILGGPSAVAMGPGMFALRAALERVVLWGSTWMVRYGLTWGSSFVVNWVQEYFGQTGRTRRGRKSRRGRTATANSNQAQEYIDAITNRATSLPTLSMVTSPTSKYALIYVGLTGKSFMESLNALKGMSARKKRASNGREEELDLLIGSDPETESLYAELLPITLLLLTPLSLSLPSALLTYLFVARTLGVVELAPISALLAAVTTSLVGIFCVGLVKDVVDGMRVCLMLWERERSGAEREGEEEREDDEERKSRREMVARAFDLQNRTQRKNIPSASGPSPGSTAPAPVAGPSRQPQAPHPPSPPGPSGPPTRPFALSSSAFSPSPYSPYEMDEASPPLTMDGMDAVDLVPQWEQPVEAVTEVAGEGDAEADIDPFALDHDVSDSESPFKELESREGRDSRAGVLKFSGSGSGSGSSGLGGLGLGGSSGLFG